MSHGKDAKKLDGLVKLNVADQPVRQVREAGQYARRRRLDARPLGDLLGQRRESDLHYRLDLPTLLVERDNVYKGNRHQVAEKKRPSATSWSTWPRSSAPTSTRWVSARPSGRLWLMARVSEGNGAA
jgi:hypothetical protein